MPASGRGRTTRRTAWVSAVLAAASLLLTVVYLVGAPSPAWGVSPHLTFTGGDTCSVCHSPHQATSATGLFRRYGQSNGEMPVCYECHDGSGSSTNVLTGADSFGLGSGHVLEGLVDTTTPADLTNTCSSCHTPHGDYVTRPKLPAKAVNSVQIASAGNAWCLACHDDAQDWFAKKGTYPPLSSPSRDASGYPVAGTFAGASVYSDRAKNAHVRIPATSGVETRQAGDCLYCHAAHGSAARYDALVATLAPSTAASVAADRVQGDYAALCFGCHDGGSWEASGAANVKRYVSHEASDTGIGASGGHRIKSAGGTLPVNAPLPCYDCHNPHGSSRGNKTLISDALGAGLDTGADADAVRRFCLTCHTTSDGLGWDSAASAYAAPASTAVVEGLLRSGGAVGSGPDGGQNWLRLRVASGHLMADTSMSCYDCHGGDYSTAASNNVHAPLTYNAVSHTGHPTAASIRILGVDYGPFQCSQCHSLELGPEHEKPSSVNAAAGCSECHPQPRSSLTPNWDKNTCAQGGCHTIISTQPMHAVADTAHIAESVGCTALGCHTGAGSLAALHSTATTTVAGVTRTSCEVCHAAGVPTSGTCVSCHDMSSPHGDDSAIHYADPGSNWITVLSGGTNHAQSETGSGSDVYVDCAICHKLNLVPLHSAATIDVGGDVRTSCGVCHGNPNADVQTVLTYGFTTCSACHPSAHDTDTMDAGHDSAYDRGACDGCHTNHHAVDVSRCASCHAVSDNRPPTPVVPPVDTTPPATSSNAAGPYVGSALITLSASDSPGGSGVATIYYTLDNVGGTGIAGTSISVSSLGSHTIEFWSVDVAGNVETPRKRATFSVSAADRTPPATTAYVNGVLAAPGSTTAWLKTASVTLSANEPGRTYYDLDSTGQRAYTGAVPVVGEGAHSLSYWSVDTAANTETHKSVTVQVDGVPPVITSDAAGAYTGSATIHLIPGDPGGSGVTETRWRLDGVDGSGVMVTTNAVGTHMLEYWSVDTAGNEELPHRTVYFTVTASTVPTTISIRTTATIVRTGNIPILSGWVTPTGMIGRNIVVYVKKPGKRYWSYSSNRTVYSLKGGAAWQYKYYFKRGMTKGVYYFRAVVPAWPGFVVSESSVISIRLK